MGGVSVGSASVFILVTADLASARATSAAPGYFKPFIHERTGIGYLDGALYYNNPVRVANTESKLIWPDTMNLPPDILLSIGTGHNADSAAAKIENADKHVRTRKPKKVELPEKTKTKKWTQLPYVGRLFQGMKDRVDNMTNAQLAWYNFSLDVFKLNREQYIQTRYQRINPDLGANPPPMDKVNRIREVQYRTRDQLEHREKCLQKIREISSRLIASSFYFEESSTPRDSGSKIFRGEWDGGTQDVFSLCIIKNASYQTNNVEPQVPFFANFSPEDRKFVTLEDICDVKRQQDFNRALS